MIFLACILHCCTQVSTPQSVWFTKDQAVMELARRHCYEIKECLVKFKKVEESVYTAICGEENN